MQPKISITSKQIFYDKDVTPEQRKNFTERALNDEIFDAKICAVGGEHGAIVVERDLLSNSQKNLITHELNDEFVALTFNPGSSAKSSVGSSDKYRKQWDKIFGMED